LKGEGEAELGVQEEAEDQIFKIQDREEEVDKIIKKEIFRKTSLI